MTSPHGSLPDDVREALQRGSIFDAIKLLRRSGVANLKEAKAVLEAEARRINAAKGVAPRPAGGAKPAPTSGAFPPAAIDALRRGNKIEAIRIVREHRGLGLKEAKDLVEAHEQMLVPTVDSLSPRNGLSPGEVPRTGGRVAWVLALATIVAALIYHFVLRDPG
ncbi:ribosomal protein L7/L12 [Aquincola sp. S2]|uniref:Ribosomal protein L7/L12 n=1 Tax=Pseudaquabacterium terrae TaxID=2732868 RepID=A0ABX2EMH6_9BURK|nr:50S ribosomal protein L7/L12 [Aquabacterium terrae]NRF69872.1 ribosomal protein L7/L12 [Aquabacterium terrae]